MEEWKKEEWREHLYEVSSLWRVRSLTRITKRIIRVMQNVTHKGRCLQPILCKWYYRITLSDNKKRKIMQIHRLVAQAFISNIDNKPTVNHKNWIKTDNRVENLERATNSEQTIHWYKNWLIQAPWKWKFGSSHNTARKIEQQSLDWKIIEKFWSIIEASRKLWIRAPNINRVCKLKRKQTWGFIRKYI